ncbi:AAA domain-containing protein [Campylobacter coli]|nr:AAA domain-containing protein [Campylobacter coli]
MNINLDEKQKKNIEEKFLEFQRIWSLEKVRNMTLEEYANLKSENPNYYCYWLDVSLQEYGGFGGPDAGKFGIYCYRNPPKKNDYLYDDKYAWKENLGNTKEEVFEKVKKEIIKVIEYSQDNNLKCIDKEISDEILPFGLKWKIAFHYQNPDDIRIVNIYTKDVLEAICKNKFKSKLEIYELHERLLKDKIYTLNSLRDEIFNPLWKEHSELSNNTTNEQNKINFSIYLNKIIKKDGSKLSEGTKKNYIDDISRISTKYLDVNLYSCDIEQFDLKCKELNNNEKYLEQNSANNKRYSSAIKYYRDFLDEKFCNDKEVNKGLNMKNMSLNQILYGPPGTGKTYHTINKALEILGYKKDENILDYKKIKQALEEFKIDYKKNDENRQERNQAKALFDHYVKEKQIVFTTFHQSYGYEEFVEGIKPNIDSEERNSKEVEYKIKPGIFKEICERALENEDNIKDFNFHIDKLKETAKEDGNNPEKYFKLPNTKYSIQYRGGKTFRIKFDDMSKNHKDYPVSIENIIKLYKTSSINEIYNSAYVKAILNYLKTQGLKDYQEKDEKTNLPYIIIIDEINRGNVSKIFGELITLIEPSKRIGEKEELKVRLPYSGDEFGVPKNVYILGTMNTADRSITSLDTALRRRFEFVEMMPDPDLLKNVFICKDVENPNKDEDYLGDDAKTEGFAEILQNILISINKRIEFLLDREKTIGHAFFMSEAVKFNKDNWRKPDEYEEDWYVLSISKLKSIFQNKIIPLLQEYFYNDYALISAVLNDNGMIEKCEKDDKYLQKIKNLDNVDSEKIIYNIASFDNEIWNDIKTYQAIYNDGENQSKK